VKHAAVRRELERDSWAHEDSPAVAEEWQPARPTNARDGRSQNGSGNSVHTWADLESMPMIAQDGAPTTTAD
jgi:hypothetical protein